MCLPILKTFLCVWRTHSKMIGWIDGWIVPEVNSSHLTPPPPESSQCQKSKCNRILLVKTITSTHRLLGVYRCIGNPTYRKSSQKDLQMRNNAIIVTDIEGCEGRFEVSYSYFQEIRKMCNGARFLTEFFISQHHGGFERKTSISDIIDIFLLEQMTKWNW